MPLSDQENRLPGQFEALSAANIAARHHVVNSHHVGASFRELLAVMVIRPARDLRLLCSNHPADGKRIFLAAVRAHQGNLLGLFLLVIESLLVHSDP